MILGFGNNVVSALAGDITAIQTDIPVMPGTGAKFAKLLSADFENKSNEQRIYAKVTFTDNKESAFEICHLVSVSGDVLKVIRGQEGTTAKGWFLNDVVANFSTRGSENYFVQIAQLQSGHYIAGVAGGTANALTLELPSTFFVNGGADWTLRTPIIVFPVQNNTNAATLQLTLGGKVLGTFPLYKGNRSGLVANDIIKGIPLICLLDSEKSYFSVINPGNIYSDFDLRYVKKSGDTMTGKLTLPQTSAFGVNTDNALGGSSITLGDNDTGFKQNGDGNLEVYANGQLIFWFKNGICESYKPLNLRGRVTPSDYGNFDARYKYKTEGIQDIRYGSEMYYDPGGNEISWIFRAPSGHGLSGINVQETGSRSADNIGGVWYRPLQKLINGTWYNVASV
ncbi:phage tail protein [Escherichia coli]|nr:phage tail protein [Escherichia coli]